MDLNIDIDALRRKHKTELVERALSVYQPEGDTQQVKSFWLERLLEGQDVRQMLDCLKQGVALPSEENLGSTNDTCVSIGRAEIIDEDLEFHAGARRKLLIRIENKSSSVWETNNGQSLFAAYHWYDADGEIYEFEGLRTPLPKPVKPDDEEAFEIDVTTPSDPGRYILLPTLIVEGVAWLEDRGLDVHRRAVEVIELKGPGMTRRAQKIHRILKNKIAEYDSQEESVCAL